MNPVDRHYLPPELAAQILERDAELAANPLSEQDREILDLLGEECAEVIQQCSKVKRFGWTVNPWDGVPNQTALEKEIGDVIAKLTIMAGLGLIDQDRIVGYAEAKIAELRKPTGRVRHIQIPSDADLGL